jgi:RNA polymerase sigma-70 factor (ECF subfamily)
MHAPISDRYFEQNLAICRKRLYDQALHLTRGRGADAEDLVQETLLRAYQWRGSFRQTESMGPWLRAILFHTFVNDYRRRRRRPQVLLSDLPDTSRRRIEENMPDPSYTRDASERGLMVREQADAAMAALDRLSTPLREALYLSLVEELSYAQISERLERAVYAYRAP